MTRGPAFNYNIWMHLYEDRYEELLAYSMKLTSNNKGLAEEMVGTLSITYFADENKLKQALAKLKPTYADVIKLHFFHQLPPKEITKRLPLTIYQVKRRLEVGMFDLRQEINPDYFTYYSRRSHLIK
jgi:DNA-directed RNA polymerase specialized sigma subunit